MAHQTPAPAPVPTATGAFNGIMDQWLSQLVQLLVEKQPSIADTYKAFRIMANDPDPQKRRRPMEMFMTKITPHADLLEQRDERLILVHCAQIPFLKSINIKQYWADFDDNQRNGMWEFLQMMYSLGSVLMAIPEPAMRMVEQMAGQMVTQMEQDGAGGPNPMAMMSMVQSMMGGGRDGGGGGLPSLPPSHHPPPSRHPPPGHK